MIIFIKFINTFIIIKHSLGTLLPLLELVTWWEKGEERVRQIDSFMYTLLPTPLKPVN